MAYTVAAGSAVSTAANTKSADQVSGVNQFVPAGRIQLFAKASATGLNNTLAVNSVPLVDDAVIPFTGTAGTLDVSANGIVDQKINGGRVQYFLRNTTGGAITADYLILMTPGK